MNTRLLICSLAALQVAGVASATILVEQDWNVGTVIPEGNPVGITVSQTFSGLSSEAIGGVSVDLNISGGYNAGLFGYLTLQDASGNVVTEILLDRIGVSSSNPFGSDGAGLQVTLSDAGTVNGSIHNAVGIPTGAWLPDSQHTLNGTFGGLSANGTWTLFLANLMEGGGTSTLESWGLSITTGQAAVPDVGVTAVMLGAAIAGLTFIRGKFRT